MTLATKNGALILKDGALAENCGCCGGWYCYGDQSCVCSESLIKSISVGIVCSDYLLHARYSKQGQTWYGSYLSMLSQVNGTHTLTRNSVVTQDWEKYLSPSFSNIGGCVYCPTPGLAIRYSLGRLTICTYYAYVTQNAQRVTALSAQPYFSKGDTVNYGSGSFVFGSTAATVGDTYNPYDPSGPRMWWWNTAASCWIFQSQCVDDVRVWSPALPVTLPDSVPFDVSLMQNAPEKTEVGQNALTLNSIDFSF